MQDLHVDKYNATAISKMTQYRLLSQLYWVGERTDV
jgi:hypothetical protein